MLNVFLVRSVASSITKRVVRSKHKILRIFVFPEREVSFRNGQLECFKKLAKNLIILKQRSIELNQLLLAWFVNIYQ